MSHSDDLLARLAAVAALFEEAGPVVEEHRIARAEQALGFPLPPLFAALYGRVADGGWNPTGDTCVAYGRLLPLETLVDGYLGDRDPEPETTTGVRFAYAQPEWPRGVVTVMSGGCFTSVCVDCLDPAAPVLHFDCDIAAVDPDAAWTVRAPSLASWLDEALDDALDNAARPSSMPVWPQWRERIRYPNHTRRDATERPEVEPLWPGARTLIAAPADLDRWATSHPARTPVPYIVDPFGHLWLAGQGAGHAVCAGGGPVRAAGHLTLVPGDHPGDWRAANVDTRSADYPLDDACLPVVADALARAGVHRPAGLSNEILGAGLGSPGMASDLGFYGGDGS
ncbi:SMI1/KNR4 family protein [Streptomyces hydrogenans]|uniref:SMI1/KNR4 family protein n=1 Tax=Streptomyces hydrogenans TaxID=1873719 RepID=UPI0033BCC22C